MSKAEKKYFVKSVERIRQRDNDEDAIPYHSHVMYNPKILSRYKLFL